MQNESQRTFNLNTSFAPDLSPSQKIQPELRGTMPALRSFPGAVPSNPRDQRRVWNSRELIQASGGAYDQVIE